MIDVEAFYLCCAQAVRTRAVVLCSKQEYVDRRWGETIFCKERGVPMVIYEPLAMLGYENFIQLEDSVFANDGCEIITLFEVVG